MFFLQFVNETSLYVGSTVHRAQNLADLFSGRLLVAKPSACYLSIGSLWTPGLWHLRAWFFAHHSFLFPWEALLGSALESKLFPLCNSATF